MFSTITQPTLKHFPSNYSPYDLKSVICGGSGKSLSWPFLINTYCFFSWERGFSMGSSVTECMWAINAIQRVFNNLLWVNAFLLIQQCRPCDVWCIESDSYSVIFLQSGQLLCCIGTVNAMVNFKQLYPFGSNLWTKLTAQVVDSNGSTWL